MGGIGFGLAAQKQNKANTAKKVDKKSVTKSSAGGDDYSDEDFESMTQSKSISMSQSKSISVSASNKINKKGKTGDKTQGAASKAKGSASRKGDKNKKYNDYSPIKEADDEGR